MNSPPQPFFNHTISIKNTFTYQDFLRRKPKNSKDFQFSMFHIPQGFFPTDERTVQLKLLRVLKIVKPVTKVDFGKFEVVDPRSWKTTLPSVFKLISRIKSLLLVRPQNNTKDNYFRYFVRLQGLYYQLDGLYFDFQVGFRHGMLFQNPLECLKYCPKVRSLEVQDFSAEGELTKVSNEPTHSLKPLESLIFISSQWDEKQEDFPMKFSKKLKSISLCFQGLESQKLRTKIMKDLSMLPDLQEMNLNLRADLNPAFITACKKIAEKQILKKITLHFDRETSSNLKKALEAFKDCQLISFSLKTFIKQAQALKLISEFIKNMDQLESLELQISKTHLFSKNDSEQLVKICKQISTLKALSSLKLNFYTHEEVSKSEKISNFITNLSDLFNKPIKIETIHLECNQIEASEALQSITSLLENSASFLKNLNLNFGISSYIKKPIDLS